MVDIALWGCGRLGRASLFDLEDYCADAYRVTRVYDASADAQGTHAGKVPAPIASPETIVDDFRAGVFEQVLVSIGAPVLAAPVKRFLADNGIPELSLGSIDDFHPASSFAQRPGSVSIGQEGYELWTFPGMCGAVPNYNCEEVMYLFDRDGRVLAEHWDAHDIGLELSCFKAFPFPFSSPFPERVRLEGSWCVLAKRYSSNYFHFVFESMDVVLLLEEAGFTGRYVIPDSPSAYELMQLAGISPDRIVRLQDLEKHAVYEFDEVCYPKAITALPERLRLAAPVLARLAEMLQRKLPLDPAMPKRLYVKRIGQRRLLNADGLAEEFGFETMVPEDHTVAEQLAFFYNADIVLTPHGANCTNSLAMRENSVLIEVYPARWHPNCFFDALREKGVRYLPLVELEPIPSIEDGMTTDFTIDERLLRETLENAVSLHKRFNL